jgi:hypothetical protein
VLSGTGFVGERVATSRKYRPTAEKTDSLITNNAVHERDT